MEWAKVKHAKTLVRGRGGTEASSLDIQKKKQIYIALTLPKVGGNALHGILFADMLKSRKGTWTLHKMPRSLMAAEKLKNFSLKNEQ